MKYWIVPSNDSTFRIGEAIAAQDGMVDWRTDRFSEGDVVFIYKTKPEQCVRYKMEVVKTRIMYDNIFEQEPYWTDKDQYYSGIVTMYARLKLLEEYNGDFLSLLQLHEHGYLGDVRSVREIKDKGLINFMLCPYQSIDEVYDVDYPEDDERYYEGALMKVNVNKYERNQKARKECVDKKGAQCMVCGRDFEKTYGEIGKGFIHIHHLVPISTIGKEYQLDIEKDLAPVCPNCHYMLHRKNPPYTIEELKDILENQNTAIVKEPKQRKKSSTILLKPEINMLRDINKDVDVRKLIHNMMGLYEGTTILSIVTECKKEFQLKYSSMNDKDWLHLIRDYVRKVTDLPNLQDEEVFRYMMTG